MFWNSWHAATTQQKISHERMCTTYTQSINFTPRNTIGNNYNIFIFTKLNNKHVRIEKKKPFKIRNWFLVFCLTFRITEARNILVALRSLFQVSKQTTEDIKTETDNRQRQSVVTWGSEYTPRR